MMQQLQPKQMCWVRADSSDFGGEIPAPHSGHTVVSIGKSKVVVFGGFAEKRFLADMAVYDVENRLWYTPECTGNGSDGQAGPSPRAFHIAVVIDCNMFIFGGRSGGKRLGDFWMLDTDIWQWSEMTGFGDLPSLREFAAASAIGNRKIVMYGGWDGKKWLSDVYIMDTSEDNETPGWTQLKLPGQFPSPRCGHSVTSGGPYVISEPRGSTEELEPELKGYYNSILGKAPLKKGRGGAKQIVKNGVTKNSSHESTKGGAAFLAVCRGKHVLITAVIDQSFTYNRRKCKPRGKMQTERQFLH